MTTNAALRIARHRLAALYAEPAEPNTVLCDQAEMHVDTDDHESAVCGWLTHDEIEALAG